MVHEVVRDPQARLDALLSAHAVVMDPCAATAAVAGRAGEFAGGSD